jgi:hypothetical protein
MYTKVQIRSTKDGLERQFIVYESQGLPVYKLPLQAGNPKKSQYRNTYILCIRMEKKYITNTIPEGSTIYDDNHQNPLIK